MITGIKLPSRYQPSQNRRQGWPATLMLQFDPAKRRSGDLTLRQIQRGRPEVVSRQVRPHRLHHVQGANVLLRLTYHCWVRPARLNNAGCSLSRSRRGLCILKVISISLITTNRTILGFNYGNSGFTAYMIPSGRCVALSFLKRTGWRTMVLMQRAYPFLFSTCSFSGS
jgi:hypothetical protein